MPIVQIELLEGRDTEQKKQLVNKMTAAVTESLNCPTEAVSIIIREMKKENYGHAGILYSDKK